jgi:hypothetical protein
MRIGLLLVERFKPRRSLVSGENKRSCRVLLMNAVKMFKFGLKTPATQ